MKTADRSIVLDFVTVNKCIWGLTYVSALEMDNWAMVQAVIHYHWQSVTASTQSFETIRGLQAGLSPRLQPITLPKARLTAWLHRLPGKLQKNICHYFCIPKQLNHKSLFPAPWHSNEYCVWLTMCIDIVIFLLMVLLWMLFWQLCPSNLLSWIQVSMYKKVHFLFWGLVGGVLCSFFLSLFSFSCVSSLFLPVFYDSTCYVAVFR